MLKVAIISSSRADYSHLYWPLKLLQGATNIETQFIVMGSHLAPEYGLTEQQIQVDGFQIDERLECLLSSDSDTGMAKTIGMATLGLADIFSRQRPDILLLIADRYEMLAAASTALAMRIPIAHIEGGEISEGAIDDAVRNAITKMSHIHFTPTAEASKRVIAMGEEPWRVVQSGAPSLDRLRQLSAITRTELGEQLNCTDIHQAIMVASYHPVTLALDSTAEIDAFLQGVSTHQGVIIFCYPNADAGSRYLMKRLAEFCTKQPHCYLYTNLDNALYWNLLQHATLMVGNSSSGIMESPSLKLPAINVGKRQQGRISACNIIQSDADAKSIQQAISQALSPQFKQSLSTLTNPYGNGYAAQTMLNVLTTLPDKQKLLIKKAQTIL